MDSLPAFAMDFLKSSLSLTAEKIIIFPFLVGCAQPTSLQGRQEGFFNPPPLLIKIKKASNLRPFYSDNHFLLVK
jgi:hypothetical protein